MYRGVLGREPHRQVVDHQQLQRRNKGHSSARKPKVHGLGVDDAVVGVHAEMPVQRWRDRMLVTTEVAREALPRV